MINCHYSNIYQYLLDVHPVAMTTPCQGELLHGVGAGRGGASDLRGTSVGFGVEGGLPAGSCWPFLGTFVPPSITLTNIGVSKAVLVASEVS